MPWGSRTRARDRSRGPWPPCSADRAMSWRAPRELVEPDVRTFDEELDEALAAVLASVEDERRSAQLERDARRALREVLAATSRPAFSVVVAPAAGARPVLLRRVVPWDAR